MGVGKRVGFVNRLLAALLGIGELRLLELLGLAHSIHHRTDTLEGTGQQAEYRERLGGTCCQDATQCSTGHGSGASQAYKLAAKCDRCRDQLLDRDDSREDSKSTKLVVKSCNT